LVEKLAFASPVKVKTGVSVKVSPMTKSMVVVAKLKEFLLYPPKTIFNLVEFPFTVLFTSVVN